MSVMENRSRSMCKFLRGRQPRPLEGIVRGGCRCSAHIPSAPQATCFRRLLWKPTPLPPPLVVLRFTTNGRSQSFFQNLCEVGGAFSLSNQTLAFMWRRWFPHLFMPPLPQMYPQLCLANAHSYFVIVKTWKDDPLKSPLPPLIFVKEVVPEIQASKTKWLITVLQSFATCLLAVR